MRAAFFVYTSHAATFFIDLKTGREYNLYNDKIVLQYNFGTKPDIRASRLTAGRKKQENNMENEKKKDEKLTKNESSVQALKFFIFSNATTRC